MGASTNQVLKWNGSSWVPATDNVGSGGTSYSAGTGINISGSVISSTLGTSIESSEIDNGTIQAIDLNQYGCFYKSSIKMEWFFVGSGYRQYG